MLAFRWGETFMSCVSRKYVQHPEAQVVNTAWAVLSLMKARLVDCLVLTLFDVYAVPALRHRGGAARGEGDCRQAACQWRLEAGEHHRGLQQELHDQLQARRTRLACASSHYHASTATTRTSFHCGPCRASCTCTRTATSRHQPFIAFESTHTARILVICGSVTNVMYE